MNRAEALTLVGTRVMAWTAANGVYVGELIEVTTHRPAQAFEFNRSRPRRGFRPGETIEVGGVNIEPSEEAGLSYCEALRRDLASVEAHLELAEATKHVNMYRSSHFAFTKSAEIRRQQIAEEPEEACV